MSAYSLFFVGPLFLPLTMSADDANRTRYDIPHKPHTARTHTHHRKHTTHDPRTPPTPTRGATQHTHTHQGHGEGQPGAHSQEWRASPHHHNRRTPARSSGEPRPRPSARSGEGPPTTAGGEPKPGVAGHRNHNPQLGVARDQPPPQRADPSQEWRGTAPRNVRQEWRGTHNTHQPHPHKHQPQAPTEKGGDKQPQTTDTPRTR